MPIVSPSVMGTLKHPPTLPLPLPTHSPPVPALGDRYQYNIAPHIQQGRVEI